VQTAAGFDCFDPGSQPEMVSVAENDPGVEFRRFQFFEANSLHRARRAHRHKDRSFNHPAARSQETSARFALLSDNLKIDCHACQNRLR